jgi:hypothetical protein
MWFAGDPDLARNIINEQWRFSNPWPAPRVLPATTARPCTAGQHCMCQQLIVGTREHRACCMCGHRQAVFAPSVTC